MGKTLKKLLSFMMAFIMIITMLPVAAYVTADEVAAADVTLTLSPFVTEITSKNGTATITPTVKVDGNTTTNYTIKWKSSDTDAVTIASNGTVKGLERGSVIITAELTHVNGNALETPVTKTAKVNVEYTLSDVYPTGENTNEYPAEGAVRINKTATSDMMDSHGLTQVELDVAGAGLRPGVDVVLVVDVSNSMGWTLSRSHNSNDADKVPQLPGEETKLKNAMDAADSFAQIMLGENNGSKYDNTVSFVTFAGYDAENGVPDFSDSLGRSDTRFIDSVKSIFIAETDYNKAHTSFAGTTIAYNNGDYTLTVKDNNNVTVVSGSNRGNTNYDYAFAQAGSAVTQLRADYQTKWGVSYSDSGRETYIVFMTDGAPSHYNGKTAAGDQNRDYLPGTNTAYPGGQYPTKEQWTQYFLNNRNTYANQLYSQVDGNFYAIGFDLANGGFLKYAWSQETLTTLLETMVEGATIPVNATANADELRQFYENLANLIKPAGTEAQVIDTVNTKDFTVQLANSVPFDVNGENSTHNFPTGIPNMQVKAYDLYTAADGDASQIGTRKGTYDVLETVTFKADGTEAYSDLIDGGTTNIMTRDGNNITINAGKFTYKKGPETDGNGYLLEKFIWNIGDIPNKEIAFSFYAYLKGSMEGTNSNTGARYTNTNATLDYVDMEGKVVQDVFKRPVAVWKDAVTEYEFYLVDKAGNPVNHAGDIIPFANRVKIGSTGHYEFPVNRTVDDVSSPIIQAADYLPEGYVLYDPKAKYEVRAVSSEELGAFIHISDPSDQATRNDQTGEQTTKDVNAEEHTYTELNQALMLSTHVAFGVRYELVPELELTRDIAVIDYAKPIDLDIIANDTAKIPEDFTYSFVGFNEYADDLDMTTRHPLNTINPTTNHTAGNGVFSLKTSGTKKLAHYELNKFLNTVDKAFGTVKFENKNNNMDKFYMYNEIDVMPANNIYYEDDFMAANNTNPAVGFVYSGLWSSEGDLSGNTETPNNFVHGGWIDGDEGLSGDDGFSDGQAHKTVTSSAKVTFNFTGTGVDVYTRTNNDSGKVRARLYKVTGTSTKLTSTKYVDNYAKSGDYYQIPTLSYNSLEYGTYKLEITAGSVTTAEGTRTTYYIDGIRVYNPIQNLESDSIVKKAYGTDELGATFTVARDLLKDGSMAFIDQIYKLYYKPEGGTKTYVEYEGKDIELATGGDYDAVKGMLVNERGEQAKDTSGRTISVTQTDSGEVECTIDTTSIILNIPPGCEIGTEAGGASVGDYNTTDLGKVAPVNEIYLDKNQSIIIQTTGSAKAYYIGIKELQVDKPASVSLTYAATMKVINVDHTTDLYYQVIPDSDNQIIVSNTGDGIISITKLRMAGNSSQTTNSVMPINLVGASEKVMLFRSLPSVDDDTALTEEEIDAEETAVEETVAEETVELSEEDITIENPKAFEENSSANAGEELATTGMMKNNKSSEQAAIRRFISLIFAGVRNLFGR